MNVSMSRKLATLALGAGLVVSGCSGLVEQLPRLTRRDLRFKPPQSSKLFASDGTLVTTFHGEQNRTLVPLERIPAYLRQAVIAIEDQRFYEHDGVDLRAVVRAALTNLRSGRIEEGGSTITQQYVKQTLIAPGEVAERSYERKIQEAALARQLETRLSKDEILERYLNTIYLGQGAYGVQAASRTYFGKPVGRINLAQAALLAGIIQQPGAYDPFENPKAARARRNLVLERMARLGYISERRAARARRKRLGLRPRGDSERYPAPYFVDYVQRLLTYDPRFKVLGNTTRARIKAIFQGGLRIHTTLDLRMQRAAEEAISYYLPYDSDPFASLVAVEPGTGYVRAMVGGRDWFARNKKTRTGRFAKFNLAIMGEPGLGPPKDEGEAPGEGRQAGSAFKVFTLAAAIEDGVPLSKRYQADDCISLPSGYRPCNYEGSAYGPVSLLEATVKSINVVYVQLGIDIGIGETSEMAMRMGIRTGQGPDNTLLPIESAPLGSQPVNPLGMASAYATFANQGMYHPPVAITKITDPTGKVIWEDRSKARYAISPSVAYIVTNVLQQVISSGTGTAAAIGRPAAGKTGTGQEYRDAWFAGYTPDLAAAVWVGHPEGEISMASERIGAVAGGTWPAMIWARFMSAALAGTPAKSFPAPGGLSYYTIDTRTGCRATEATPEEYRASAPFAAGTSPPEPGDAQCAVAAEEIEVPSVIGFPAGRAQAELEEAGLSVEVVERPSDDVPPGRVFEQSPRPGETVPAGSTVTLYVATRN